MFTAVIVAFIVALAFAALFPAFGRARPWTSFWPLFLVIFLFTWLIGIWVVPTNAALGGFAWLPFLIGGLLIALLVAAILPPSRRPETQKTPDEKMASVAPTATIGILFWMLIIFLVIGIILRYMLLADLAVTSRPVTPIPDEPLIEEGTTPGPRLPGR